MASISVSPISASSAGSLHLQDDQVLALEARLGREPLEPRFSAAWLEARSSADVARSRQSCSIQGLIGGLGNIYVDESLFRAGIHPERAPTRSPPPKSAGSTAPSATFCAPRSTAAARRSPFEDADGNRGRYGARLQVYGRGGKVRCPRCATPLERTIVGGRGTSYCPHCQPLVGEA